MVFNKFHDSKIYLIKSDNPEIKEQYYGSTTMSLHHRMCMHRSAFKKFKNENKGKNTLNKLFQKHGIDSFYISLVENIKCETKQELLKKECDYINNNNCVNKNKPFRTPEETRQLKRLISAMYYLKNRAKHLNYVKKKYHEKKQLNSSRINEPS